MKRLSLLGILSLLVLLGFGCGGEESRPIVAGDKIVNDMAVVGNIPPQTGSGTYTLEEVAKHNVKEDCYTIINGSVYNLTSAIPSHPGGPLAIIGLCGKDSAEKFTNKHGGQEKPETALANFKIGELAE